MPQLAQKTFGIYVKSRGAALVRGASRIIGFTVVTLIE